MNTWLFDGSSSLEAETIFYGLSGHKKDVSG